ncbi:MAG: Trm112 family protein [Sphingomonadales bacterium]|nr:Trm112 family protein [Sphingomonadales bacterium]NCO50230.1 Trm112 family protein [Sphingomonadales bacterium]NCP01685.1 Trm112 family protein [Sphingomonadales bacterium]NCP25667.1 Trm112 family protein [Sphingomonadales bacterium]NCP43971.1 Trm112 family protein [Sphingomonadales bacterium]
MNADNRTIYPELLDILVCPMTRTALVHDADARELISEAAGVAYPIRDGIPVMLIEEARPL